MEVKRTPLLIKKGILTTQKELSVKEVDCDPFARPVRNKVKKRVISRCPRPDFLFP